MKNIRPFDFTAKEALRVLSYDPGSGVFRWNQDMGNGARKGDVAGCQSTSGYWLLRINGGYWLAHRVAWLITYGDCPVQVIDHINQNPLDNRIANLRVVTVSENRQNMGKYRNNKSGQKGVHWFAASGKWQAQICHEKKRHHLGFFDRIEDAVSAYAEAASRLHKYNPNAVRSA